MEFSGNPLSLQYKGFIETPSLWTEAAVFGLEQYSIDPGPPFGELSPDELEIPSNLVLGRRVEFFFTHFLKIFTSEKILAANLVINSQSRTLGELDYLLVNQHTGMQTHLELVYKFYLYDPDIPEERARWIGPNRADTLNKKLDKLITHQFPLLYRPQTQALLEDLNTSAKDFKQQVCFKANLFVPLDYLQHSLPMINDDCIQGYWIRFEDFLEEDYGNGEFHTPSKWNWPIDPSACRSWITYKKVYSLVLQLHQARKSPLVWMKTRQGEYKKFFVVWW